MQYRLNDILAFLHDENRKQALLPSASACRSQSSANVSPIGGVLKVELLHRSTCGVVPTDKDKGE